MFYYFVPHDIFKVSSFSSDYFYHDYHYYAVTMNLIYGHQMMLRMIYFFLTQQMMESIVMRLIYFFLTQQMMESIVVDLVVTSSSRIKSRYYTYQKVDDFSDCIILICDRKVSIPLTIIITVCTIEQLNR